MTIEHITLTRCDRCNSTISATEGDELPEITVSPYSMTAGVTATISPDSGTQVLYSDLCPRCQKLWARRFADLQPTDAKRKGGE